MTSVINKETKLKVSSVLNKDVKNYGKQHLIDRDEESCWNSDTGLPQSITLAFNTKVQPKNIKLTFQGGFVGKVGMLYISLSDSGSEYYPLHPFYFDDINSEQIYNIDISNLAETTINRDVFINEGFDRLRIQFDESTDFFGRIVVYNLDLIQ